MKATPVEIAPLLLDAAPFRVQFHRHYDRFTHQLQLPNGIGLLESVTEWSDAPWPTDPPLQQLVLEDIAGKGAHAALGVGMSGHGHWSLAAEPSAVPRPGVRFDWACKIHRRADRLLSSYRIDPSVRIDITPPVAAPLFAKELRLQHANGFAWQLHVDRGRIEFEMDEGIIRILPDGDWEQPGTYRWCYNFVAE